MVDKVRVRKSVGTPSERAIDLSVAELGRSFSADPEWTPAATLTLTEKHQGRCLVFTNACVVTVPTGLPEGFACGILQAGAGVVSLQAGSGVTLNSSGGALKSGGQWAIGGLCAIATEQFVAYGQLVA